MLVASTGEKWRQKLKKLIAIFVLLGVILILNSVQAQQKYTKSTWLWQTDTITDKETVQFLIDKDVTTVYLQIDTTMPNEMYAAFINKMQKANIKVHALDGGPEWDIANFDALWEWLKEYQQEYSDLKFTAVHLDVEPYLSALWIENKKMAIYQYQELLQHTQQQARDSNLRFEVDIPFWYDEVFYNNTFGKGNLAEWVISRVDGVSIMAYRNTVPALKSITKNEMNYAKKYKTPIVIGVETIPFPNEPQVSFSTKGEKQMNRALEKITKYYAKNRYFNGVAIHHVPSWEALKK